RCPAGRGAEPVTDGREARLDLEGGGLEVVSARARVRPTERVPPPVHLGGRAPERRDHQRVRGWLERQRFDHLTDAPDPGAPADQAERHVGAEGGGSGGVGDARQRSTAAASADPPPRPAPGGMRLSTWTWARRSASASARRTRFVSSTGRPAPAPVISSPSPSRNDSVSNRSTVTISASSRW